MVEAITLEMGPPCDDLPEHRIGSGANRAMRLGGMGRERREVEKPWDVSAWGCCHVIRPNGDMVDGTSATDGGPCWWGGGSNLVMG